MPRRRSPELSIGWLADRLHSHVRAFYVLFPIQHALRAESAHGRKTDAMGTGRPKSKR